MNQLNESVGIWQRLWMKGCPVVSAGRGATWAKMCDFLPPQTVTDILPPTEKWIHQEKQWEEFKVNPVWSHCYRRLQRPPNADSHSHHSTLQPSLHRYVILINPLLSKLFNRKARLISHNHKALQLYWLSTLNLTERWWLGAEVGRNLKPLLSTTPLCLPGLYSP